MMYVGAAANAAVMIGYFAISYRILRGLVVTRQLSTNRLGLVTGLIFFSCALGHGVHLEHLIAALFLGARGGMAVAIDWHLVVVDLLTAGIASWHWSLRKQYGALLQAGQLYVDVKARQRQALEINDNVVQGLAAATYALDLDDRVAAQHAIDATLASARDLIGDLLGTRDTPTRLGPGDLVRDRAATVPTGGPAGATRVIELRPMERS